jgi:hypothetical protein
MFFTRQLLLIVASALLSVFMVPSSMAQDTSSWEMVMYVDFAAADGYLLTVTPDDYNMVRLPTALYTDFYSEDWRTYETRDVSLSPDGSWLAVSTGYTSQDEVFPLRITNLAGGTCCFEYRPLPKLQSIDLAGFDPTGEWFGFSYVGQEFEGGPTVGGMMAVSFKPVDEAFPEIQVSMDAVAQAQPGLPSGVWARMGNWLGEGLLFHPNCYGCEGISQGEYALWKPGTGEILAQSGRFFHDSGVRLEGTGEVIASVYDPAYPSEPGEGMVPNPNVLRYSPSGNLNAPDAVVIFNDPETPNIGQPHWVDDGRAIMLVPPDQPYYVLIRRDGTTERLPKAPGIYFFTGTPDGWLALTGDEGGDNLLLVYSVQQQAVTQTISYGSGMSIRVARPPMMGTGLAQPPQPFVPVSLPPAAPTQEADAGWEQKVYMSFEHQAGFLVTLTATDDSGVNVPESMYAGFPPDGENYVTTGVRLSPDGRYLALSVQNRATGEVYPVAIADMQAGGCCWYVVRPLPIVYAINLGGFDPTSQWLSLSYVGQESEGGPMVGGMMAVPVLADEGTIDYRVSMEQVSTALPQFSGNMWAFMGDWREDGIRFRPHCYACDAMPEGEYALWQPENNTFQASTGEFFSIMGAQLESTGEFVTAAYDPAYQIFPTEGIPAPNVVRYAPFGNPYSPGARVIFYHPSSPDIGQVHWVYGGRAVLVTPPRNQPWTLIFRDGTTQQIDGRTGRYFLVGTPDGWIEQSGDEEGNTLLLIYDFEQNMVTHTVTIPSGFDPIPIAPLVVQKSRPAPDLFLGVPPPSTEEVATLQGIATATMPTPTPNCFYFDASLATRLQVGQQGRVTPGTPNRLRDMPSLTSHIIGEILGGGVFEVLEGPICDWDNKIVWWRVQHGDSVGWTAESQDGTYYTEPIE